MLRDRQTDINGGKRDILNIGWNPIRTVEKLFERFRLSDDGAGRLLQYCLYALFATRIMASCHHHQQLSVKIMQQNTTFASAYWCSKMSSPVTQEYLMRS